MVMGLRLLYAAKLKAYFVINWQAKCYDICPGASLSHSCIKHKLFIFAFNSYFQSKKYKNIELIPGVPNNGCSKLRNADIISGKIVLLQRGYVLSIFKMW